MDRPMVLSVSIDGDEPFEVHIGNTPEVQEFAEMTDEEFGEYANSDYVKKEGNSLKAYITAAITEAVEEYFEEEVNE